IRGQAHRDRTPATGPCRRRPGPLRPGFGEPTHAQGRPAAEGVSYPDRPMTELQPRPELWSRPATRIAAAGGRGFRVAEPSLKGLREASAEIVQRPLLEPDGSVVPEVADADILISGGATVDDAVLSKLRKVRFLLRPYVGY